MTTIRDVALEATGVLLVTVGVGMVFLPAALMLIGAYLVFAANVLED